MFVGRKERRMTELIIRYAEPSAEMDRVVIPSEVVSRCMIDGHYIGYVQCFTNWCRHWATDELKWIGGEE